MIETIKAVVETEKRDTMNFWEFYQTYIYKVQDSNISREFTHLVNTNIITVANLSALINETCRNLVILNG
jgi:hypothetical protein